MQETYQLFGRFTAIGDEPVWEEAPFAVTRSAEFVQAHDRRITFSVYQDGETWGYQGADHALKSVVSVTIKDLGSGREEIVESTWLPDEHPPEARDALAVAHRLAEEYLGRRAAA